MCVCDIITSILLFDYRHMFLIYVGYNKIRFYQSINLLQMKDQVKIRFHENARNVEKCPRARHRAKIYKQLESTYLDKEKPVCIWYTDINALILNLIRFG